MTLKYYHAEPAANSLKSMIPLIEKGLPYQSIYVDLHKFEQHADWFVAINPEGQVPVLDHDGRDRHSHEASSTSTWKTFFPASRCGRGTRPARRACATGTSSATNR